MFKIAENLSLTQHSYSELLQGQVVLRFGFVILDTCNLQTPEKGVSY